MSRIQSFSSFKFGALILFFCLTPAVLCQMFLWEDSFRMYRPLLKILDLIVRQMLLLKSKYEDFSHLVMNGIVTN